jgi:release factor glutamine methyltransferase
MPTAARSDDSKESMPMNQKLDRRAPKARSVTAFTLFLISALVFIPIFLRGNWFSKQRHDPKDFILESQAEAKVGNPNYKIKQWRSIHGIERDLAQFETVFWEPNDTASLRTWLQQTDQVPGASVLEIGTGTGLIAILCKTLGAKTVVATDINPAAIACARYNNMNLNLEPIDFRQVSHDQPAAFAVVDPNEKFDLIISNPPWENAPVTEVAAYAFYDPDFALLDGIVALSAEHLNVDGHLLLAYGAKSAIQRICDKAPGFGWSVTIHDDRDLESLPEVFLPGMLLELTQNK